ncbi:tyrosine-type recombinase/integrase [Nocardia cyriacigeorgica]|uniref:tyrosine-type recombinase/integrase n=1 Tax=Nocardia cyriacigeorgica TaxID=135487 RepID=UPI002454B6BD|nr:phage integrase SAM-like domain-containing protein [Nocardia cyriacigeorgica]
MAYIRSYDTTARRNGKPVKRYEVVWREPVRDEYGLPVPVDPAKPNGRKKTRACQESYPTREAAEARRDELNAARHSTGTAALAQARKAGDLPFGYYARAWLDSLQLKVSQGRMKQRTLDDYDKYLQRYALKAFSGTAIASITPWHCEEFLASLVRRQSRQGERLSPATVKHAWGVFGRVLKYAVRHDAIPSNPADRVDFDTNRATGDHEGFEHHPLSAEQVARLSAAVAGELVTTPTGAQVGLPAYPIYGLMVQFLAYTGLRASENAGLEVGDLEFTTAPPAPGAATAALEIRCKVHVRRTKERKNVPTAPSPTGRQTGRHTRRQWVTGTLKSKRSRRTVPLPPWLAARLHAYLYGGAGSDPAVRHLRADDPTAPLWPSRKNGGGHRKAGQRYAVPHDWSQPLAMGTFYDTILKPALVAIGLPASAPAQPATSTAPAVPATRGIRLHDLRHTFATMQLMAGVHFMQVSKWLGHSTFTLTLNTYGDWIPEEDGGAANLLPEPPAPATHLPPQEVPSNVVPLFGRKSG